ncbi:MAG: AzlC family ABC transporter permease [Victivallaceae bacterium]|nr:AzlC family ABC transporter permease [Victivallaceae bacterium]
MPSAVVRRAFVASLPVLMGYLSMGMAWAVLFTTRVPGATVCDAALVSAATISGSMQFSAVEIIRDAAFYSPCWVAFLALMINIRYAAYALPFIGEFRTWPAALRSYLLFGLTDETYAILLQCPFTEEKSRRRYFLAVTAFDQTYWVVGSTLGALLGRTIRFNTTGIDFSMTALFLVILVEQCRDRSNRIPAFIGGAVTALVGAICLVWFPAHADKMLFPAMACIAGLLLALRKKTEVRGS